MRKSKTYDNTRFAADVLRESVEVFRALVKSDTPIYQGLSADVDDATWTYDNLEEFFAGYRKSVRWARFSEHHNSYKDALEIQVGSNTTMVDVAAPERGLIEAVFAVFEKHAVASLLPTPPVAAKPSVRPTIFIGHGGSPQWRDLKDHLHEKHQFPVEAYEIGARAGHAIRDVLSKMLSSSSLAVLVMTGEDHTPTGGLRARQNVVHEAGLFQGRLGFTRAIILLERGTEEFSNINGIEQIRFDEGRIKETFGDVLATIRREFPTERL